MITFKRNTQAFTLLEIMLALTILVLGVITFLRLYPSWLKASRLAGDLTDATILAQKKLEEMKAQGPLEEGSASGNFSSEGFPLVSYDLAISLHPAIPGLLHVELGILWQEEGRERREEFVTYLQKG